MNWQCTNRGARKTNVQNLVEIMMMKWKHDDSNKDLPQQKIDQTKVWRECEAIIKNAKFDRRYKVI